MANEKFTIKTGVVYEIGDIPEHLREIFLGAAHQGQCDEDVEEASKHFEVDDPAGVRDYLQQFGAWDDAQLEDDEMNLRRVIWLMSGDIQEQGTAYIGI